LGAASLAAYESLYHQAGCRAGRVRFTAESLGAEFGRDRRTAWDWIGALIASRLLAIHGREERTGLIDADVADPADALLGRIEGDPQSTFEFAQDGATERNDGARGFLHENPRAHRRLPTPMSSRDSHARDPQRSKIKETKKIKISINKALAKILLCFFLRGAGVFARKPPRGSTRC
jgi:hypothetical protein